MILFLFLGGGGVGHGLARNLRILFHHSRYCRLDSAFVLSLVSLDRTLVTIEAQRPRLRPRVQQLPWLWRPADSRNAEGWLRCLPPAPNTSFFRVSCRPSTKKGGIYQGKPGFPKSTWKKRVF